MTKDKPLSESPQDQAPVDDFSGGEAEFFAAALRADNVTMSYDRQIIGAGVSALIPERSFTVIIGPNASGKSTLLRVLSRLLAPGPGRVLLGNDDIAKFSQKDLAKRLGLLPQHSVAPDGITVADLVSRGRYPHQNLWRQWTGRDEKAVQDAMAITGVSVHSHRRLAELSGGQQQRVWVALALAQQTPVLLLDEPTTYLDLAHQVELLELFSALNGVRGQTVVAVLHDLNQACRYANHVIAMKDGQVVQAGNPKDMITAELVYEVFGVESVVIADPVTGDPLVVPDRKPARLVPRLE